MKYRIARVADSDEMREIHNMAFGGDPWPGDDHEFWVAFDSHGAVAGFASAIMLNSHTAYLSRAAVTIKHRGNGLHAKLIKTREAWAAKEGAALIVTHVKGFNYSSLLNLIRANYQFAKRDLCPPGCKDFHFLYKIVSGRTVLPQDLRKATFGTVAE